MKKISVEKASGGGKATRAEVYGLFIAAIVLLGGGAGVAVAVNLDQSGTSEIASEQVGELVPNEDQDSSASAGQDQDSSASAGQDQDSSASAGQDQDSSASASPVSSPTPSPTVTPNPEPTKEPVDLKKVANLLLNIQETFRPFSNSNAASCLVENCGEREGTYCAINRASGFVDNCFVWNGFGNGWWDGMTASPDGPYYPASNWLVFDRDKLPDWAMFVANPGKVVLPEGVSR